MDFLIGIPFRFYFYVSSTREKKHYTVQYELYVLYITTTGMFLQILKY
jgi:hypothetical protein